jgi:hypothetical protein
LIASVLLSIPFESQSNILQADFPHSASASVLQLKPAVLLKALDVFPPKLSEVTLLLEWPEQPAADGSGGMAAAAEEASIRLKSFDQAPQATHAHTAAGGAQQIIEQQSNTETTIPCAQLERFEVSAANSATRSGQRS